MIRLQGLKGCCEGEAFEFDETKIIVGRSSACDLVVDDASCSRQHAAIELTDEGYRICDLGSTNGIKLNREQVHDMVVPIVYGDRFTLGRNLFIFLAKVPSEDTVSDGEEELGVTDLVDVGDVENRLTHNMTDLTHVINTGVPPVSSEDLEELQRTHQQMHFVYRVSRALNSTLERDGLIRIITDHIFEEFHEVERVSICLVDSNDPSQLIEAESMTRDPEARKLPISRSVLEHVERERAGIVAGNAVVDERFGCSHSTQEMEVRALMCVPLLIGAKYLGAVYVENCTRIHCFTKTDLELLTVLANQSASALGNALLYEELQTSFFETVRSLGNTLEAKDKYTRGHGDRVARYAVGIGKELGFDLDQLQTMQVAAELHDIGKIAITESIIGKNGKLTEEEFQAMKKHPELGVEILKPIRVLKSTLLPILHHHERYNGTGYPSGLRGEDIPMEARILNLADAFDAMTTQRPYNTPMSREEALACCEKESGDAFDPECVNALNRYLQSETDEEADAESAAQADLISGSATE